MDQFAGCSGYQSGGSGVAPEPILQLISGSPAGLTLSRIEIPIAQVVTRQTKPFMQGAFRVSECGFVSLCDSSDLANDLFLGGAAGGGNHAGLLQMDLVPRFQLAEFVQCGRHKFAFIGIGSGGKCDRTRPGWLIAGSVGVRRGIFGEVLEQHGTAGSLEELQCCLKHAFLQRCFMGRAEGATQGEGDPKKSRQLH